MRYLLVFVNIQIKIFFTGLENVIESLIDHGADLNAVDINGNSAMILAAKNGNKHVNNTF